MEYIFVLFILNFVFYLLFLSFNIFSLCRHSNYKNNNIVDSPVSVIVAIRNGQQSLSLLIKKLLNQDYRGDIEIILVDDQSNDDTKKIIMEAQEKHPQIKYASSDEGAPNLKFKKKALDAGIKKSIFDILLFTDVDCQVGKSWVSSMANCFTEKVDYVIGFSRAQYIFGLANLFQRVDFLMMMFSAKAVTNIGFPLASSGQNQAFRKKLFFKVGGYNKISDLLMGDDSIFLQLCLKEKARVVFCNDYNSYVFCRAESNWKDLLLQKMRWAGDGNMMWKYNYIFYQIMISTVISNMFIFFLLTTASMYYLIIVLFIKFFFELIFCIAGTLKSKEKIDIISFIYWYIVNIPYVCVMCIASFFVPMLSWHNRKQ